jgi:hypothetical protein
VKRLPFRWADDDAWKRAAFGGGDDRRPRLDTPQYQSEDDRQRAIACGAESCEPPT